MKTLSEIPTEELQKDLQETKNDISVCQVALNIGIQHYSTGSVKDRLETNKNIENIIIQEINRRENCNFNP
jgi:hypothetical protein